MSFKILYITATAAEAETLRGIKGISISDNLYRFGNLEISSLVAGIGSASTAWNINHWLSLNEKPDLAINAGIAGSFKDDLKVGEVVLPVTDCFADAGIEDGENFLTLFEAGLTPPDEFPYRNGFVIANPEDYARIKHIISPVRAITVNTSTGSEETKNKLVKKFNPDIETLEGATFFYICIREKIPFLALRAISNIIERRNRNNWNIALALKKLSEKLNEVFIEING
jgi:futalosine hydrolase